MNSTNGTFVDGRRVEPDERRVLALGSVVEFGASEESWNLADAAPPVAALVPIDEQGAPILAKHDTIEISCGERIASIHGTSDGSWWLDRAGVLSLLHDQARVEIGGRYFYFVAPAVDLETAALARSFTLSESTLHFAVSHDEEHVTLRIADVAGRRCSLGGRACFYLLLTLARHRLLDHAQHEDAGWMDARDLARRLRIDTNQMNVDIFRVRKAFAEAGMRDALHIIERRSGQRLLRVGTSRLCVERD